MSEIKECIFYTDGSSKNNPGEGGFGVIEYYDDTKRVQQYFSKRYDNVTNNRMELEAILYVVKQASCDPEHNYIIYSDSAYCVNIINNWMRGWARNNWTRNGGKPIKNLDLIKDLYNLFNIPFFNAEVRKCTGHIGNIGNELADALANNNSKKFDKIIKENNILVDCT